MMTRRHVLIVSATSTLACLAGMGRAHAWSSDLQEQQTFTQWMQETIDISTLQVSGAVIVNVPDIAENSQVVQLSVQMQTVCQRLLVCDKKSPQPLLVDYDFFHPVNCVKVRVVLPRTTDIVALAYSEGNWLMAQARVKVVSGCGGGG